MSGRHHPVGRSEQAGRLLQGGAVIDGATASPLGRTRGGASASGHRRPHPPIRRVPADGSVYQPPLGGR